ncbi:MAG: hypothetical protein KME30_05930 [Iphinoe sp. HA4291-MV1]|nr:hypothetical protein [Iphinoe sp. HA4291-MV1]
MSAIITLVFVKCEITPPTTPENPLEQNANRQLLHQLNLAPTYHKRNTVCQTHCPLFIFKSGDRVENTLSKGEKPLPYNVEL